MVCGGVSVTVQASSFWTIIVYVVCFAIGIFIGGMP